MAGWEEGMAGVVKNHLSERSCEVELPQGVLRRNRIHLRKTNEPAATTNDTQPEECNEPQRQELGKPVTETNELPSQSAVEVTPSPAPMKPPEPNRLSHELLQLKDTFTLRKRECDSVLQRESL